MSREKLQRNGASSISALSDRGIRCHLWLYMGNRQAYPPRLYLRPLPPAVWAHIPLGNSFLEPILSLTLGLYLQSIPEPWQRMPRADPHKDSVPKAQCLVCTKVWGIPNWLYLWVDQCCYWRRTESIPSLAERCTLVTFPLGMSKEVERKR